MLSSADQWCRSFGHDPLAPLRRPYVELLDCGLTKKFSVVDADDSELLVRKVWSGGVERGVQQGVEHGSGEEGIRHGFDTRTLSSPAV